MNSVLPKDVIEHVILDFLPLREIYYIKEAYPAYYAKRCLATSEYDKLAVALETYDWDLVISTPDLISSYYMIALRKVELLVMFYKAYGKGNYYLDAFLSDSFPIYPIIYSGDTLIDLITCSRVLEVIPDVATRIYMAPIVSHRTMYNIMMHFYLTRGYIPEPMKGTLFSNSESTDQEVLDFISRYIR